MTKPYFIQSGDYRFIYLFIFPATQSSDVFFKTMEVFFFFFSFSIKTTPSQGTFWELLQKSEVEFIGTIYLFISFRLFLGRAHAREEPNLLVLSVLLINQYWNLLLHAVKLISLCQRP